MNKGQVWVVGVLVFCASALFGLDSDVRSPLTLVPAPKEVQLREGQFRVGPKTKIFVQLGHQSEDRIAAETLAEEVADQSGLKLDILGMKAAGKAEGGAIVLAADSCYFCRTLRERRLPQNVHDRAAMLASLDKLARLEMGGARIFFGHDGEFWKRVPQAPLAIG